MNTTIEDLSGRQLGPYRIIAQVGKGGMAVVYKAYQPSMDRYVAVKVLPRQMAADPQFTGRFENEARLLARLQHPYILPVFDFGQDEGYAYFVMPLVETGTLAQLLHGQPLPIEQISEYMIEIGEALDYAHSRGLLHRDVKPSNVLIDESGNCLLTDFGIAKLVDSVSHFTATGTLVGTPAYMSPEQGRGQELDRRSDIYSLGIILYELATGRVPFSADTPVAVIFKHIQDPLPPVERLNPSLPPALVQVIYTALAKNPDHRFQTVGAMVEAVRAIGEETRVTRSRMATVIEPLPTASPAGPPPPSESDIQPGPPGGAAPPLPPGTAGPAPAQPPARRRGLGGGALLGLGGLAGLAGITVVGLLCAAVIVVPRLLNAQVGLTATRTPATTAPVTRSTSTATRAPASTPTDVSPTDRPLPTATPRPADTGSGVLLEDDFESDSGWETSSEDDSRVAYLDGELVIEIFDTRWRVPSLAPASDLADIHLRVSVRSLGAENDPPIVGAICDYQSDGSYYYLGFSPDGYYGIAYYDGEDGYFLNTDEDSWQASDAIEKFAEEYQLEVDCAADGTLRLAVNGVEVDSVVDDTLASGRIGLFASSFDSVPVEVHFDDVLVTTGSAPEALYQDDFEDSNSGWDTTITDVHALSYRDGAYFFEVFEPNWRITSFASAGDLADFHLAVTVASVGAATDPGYGVLCHIQDDGAYYYLGFGPDGYYAIGYYDGEASHLLTNDTNDWIVSDDIEQYADPYLLEVECGGDGTLRLIVNGVEIAAVVDETLTSGDIGLFVSSFEEAPVEVYFDDLIVTPLQ